MLRKNFIATAAGIAVLWSCSQQEFTPPPHVSNYIVSNSNFRTGTQDNDGEIVLGEKLTNPYALKNMATALNVLQKTEKSFDKFKLEATHNYVRIEAVTAESFARLQSISEIDLFRYPLDYEVIKSGSRFKEKDYSVKLQVFWAAVPTNFIFEKDLKIKIIEPLFLPFGTRTESKKNASTMNEEQLKLLEDKALTMFDSKYYGSKSKNMRVTAVQPFGHIRVWDDYKSSFLPIEGVSVRGKRWFTVTRVKTDQWGFYNFTYTYNGPVDLCVEWEDTNFEIQIQGTNPLNTYVKGETSKNNVEGNWTINIVGIPQVYNTYFSSADAFRLAHTWRAAHLYYYKNTNWGVRKPPLPGRASLNTLNPSFLGGLFGFTYGVVTSKLKMGIRNYNGYNDFSHTWMTTGLQGGVHIVLNYLPNSVYTSTGNFTALDIFATTIHEMTHAQHFDIGYNQFDYANNAKAMLAETWALAVEYKIVMDTYNIKNTTVYHANINSSAREYDYRNLQIMPTSNFRTWKLDGQQTAYTPAMIDLIDNHNQGLVNNQYLNESVNGLSIQILQNAMISCPKDWKGVRNIMMSSYPAQSSNINSIFNTYSQWDPSLQ